MIRRILLAAVVGVGLVGHGSPARAGEAAGPLADVAVTASASADGATDGHPAAAAVDGDGTTTWCPAGASGTLTVDLGRPVRLGGFGVTLLGGAGTVTVSTAAAPGRFR